MVSRDYNALRDRGVIRPEMHSLISRALVSPVLALKHPYGVGKLISSNPDIVRQLHEAVITNSPQILHNSFRQLDAQVDRASRTRTVTAARRPPVELGSSHGPADEDTQAERLLKDGSDDAVRKYINLENSRDIRKRRERRGRR